MRPWRSFALLALLLALPAEPRAEEPFSVVTLENGLTLLLAPSEAHPVIALSGYVTTGGRTEDEYYQGSLHYIEHLVFKGGTPNLAPTEFRKKMSLLGRESGGWTWDDEINFGFEVPKETFEEALGVFREALLDLEFEDQWFEDEKLVVLQEMTRWYEQPSRLIYKAWNELAFVVHPYGRPVIGSEKAIRELDLEKTEDYYRRRFTPNHMILSISGDFDRDEMIAMVRKEWSALKPGPASFELGLVEPEQTGERFRTDHMPQATNTVFLSGAVTPGGSHEDTPALEMLAALMNDDSYGLPQFLVDQEKWVASISASQYAMRDYGTFQIFGRMEPERSDAVARFVKAFLLDFDVTRVPEEIFEETRRGLLFQEAERRKTAADRAERFGFLVSRRGQEAAAALEESYRKLSPADVQAAKERWLGARRLVTAMVHPEEFDPAAGSERSVTPAAPFAPPPPDLKVAGALETAETSAIAYEETASEGDVSLYTFANGLRVLVRESSASDLLAVTGRVLGGQWVEPSGQAGINRFVSEMGLRATRRWNREGFSRLLGTHSLSGTAHANVGSRANTSRNVDYRDSAAHHYTGLKDQWPEMLAILKETLFFPNFLPEEVEKLREDLLTEVRSLQENNLELIKQEFYVAAYGEHPYGRPTVGTEESLSGLTIENLQAFHDQCWTPDRVVITVVGRVKPDEIAEWISTRWADLTPTPKAPWSLDPNNWSLEWNPPSETHVVDLGKDYWTVNWGRPGASFNDPLYYPSIVLSRMAGSDHFYKYVYDEGVSYRSWIRFWDNLGPGAWIVENDVKRERFDEILGMFDEDLVRYSTLGFTEKEFADAVLRMINASILDDQDNALLAWKLAVAEGNGAGFRRTTQHVENLQKVTLAEVQALAEETFQPEKILRVVQQ